MSKNVKQKLLDARKIISETKMKKGGKNSYSNYDYFTPDQVNTLVTKASIEVGILSVFQMIEDAEGFVTGNLYVMNVDGDKEDVLLFTTPTRIPEIKATNATQKLGGAMTYTERYLQMTAFGIVDNSLDFDSQDNRPKEKTEPKKPADLSDADYKKKVATLNKKEVITKPAFHAGKSFLKSYDPNGKNVKALLKLMEEKVEKTPPPPTKKPATKTVKKTKK